MQFLGPTIVSKVPIIVGKLRSVGLWTESRYVFGEVIQGVRTQRELSEMVHLVTAECTPGLLADPCSAHDLTILLRQLLSLNYPHAAVRVLTSGIGSCTSKFVNMRWAGLDPLTQRPNLAEMGIGMLQVGEPQGLTFCAASCYLGSAYESTVYNCSRHLEHLTRRELPFVPTGLLTQLADFARDFADVGRHSSAVGVGLLVPMLAKNQAWLDRIDEHFAVTTGLDSPRHYAAQVGRRLYQLGYLSHAAEFYILAIDVSAENEGPWKQIWNLLQTEVFQQMPGVALSGGEILQRRFRSAFHSVGAKLPSPGNVALKRVVEDVAKAEVSKVAPALPQRELNVWIEEGQPPFEVDVASKIYINIGQLRRGAIGGGQFPEPDWGSRDALDLLLVLEGDDLDVKPAVLGVVLPRLGETPVVSFTVTPRRGGSLDLCVSVFLERESILLEEFRVRIEVGLTTAV